MFPAARDLSCVAVLAIVVGLAVPRLLHGVVPPEQGHLVLTLVAASAGAAAAILADMAWRLSQDRRLASLSAALALYSLTVVPSTTIDVITERGDAALQAGRSMAFLTVIVLLGLTVRPPDRLSAAGGWLLAGIGFLLTLATVSIVLLVPDPVAVVDAVSATPVVLAVGFVAVAVALAIAGLRQHHPASWRIALGLLVVGAAQLYRIGYPDTGDEAVTFSTVRLLGLLIVLVALIGVVRAALQAVRDEQDELLEATTDAYRATEETAERDHELRNGLAGLAGSIQLLSAARNDFDHRRLQAAVDAELNRLSTILDPSRPRQEPGSYVVGEVLDHLVTLWRAAGSSIELTADRRLRVVGSASVLAQVVTNLLANCARHAPGASVTLRAFRRGDLAVVEVADDGPGIPPDVAEVVLRRGVRQGNSPGEGLGLHISRQLTEGVGGTLRVLPVERGCVVQVELPVAATPGHQLGVSAVLAR